MATSARLWPGGFGPRLLPPTLSPEIAPRVRHIDWTRFLRRVLDAEGLLEADEVMLLGGQRMPSVDFIYQLYECLMSMGSAKPTAAELHQCWVGQWAAVERDMEVGPPPPFPFLAGGTRSCCRVGASLAAPACAPNVTAAPLTYLRSHFHTQALLPSYIGVTIWDAFADDVDGKLRAFPGRVFAVVGRKLIVVFPVRSA